MMHVCKNMCKSPMCLCMCARVHMYHMYTCDMGTRVSRQLCIPICLCMCTVTLQMCQCPKGCTVSIRGHVHHESESESHSVMSNSLQPCGLQSLWNFPGQNTGVGSFSLLQGIFPTQGSNPSLPHCRWIPYQLSHQGSPVHHEVQLYVL